MKTILVSLSSVAPFRIIRYYEKKEKRKKEKRRENKSEKRPARIEAFDPLLW